MNTSNFTKNGYYLMLALDQRGSFKKLMNPQNPDQVSDEDIISLKRKIINAVKDQFSGLLIDKGWGYEAFDKRKPFLLPFEKSGYVETEGERITELEYDAHDLKNFGATGGKLLVYFNPYSSSAKGQLTTSRRVLADCRVNKLPLFLEIVTYNPDGSEIKDKAQLVLDSVKAFIDFNVIPDVWKLEYPENLEGCIKLTELVGKTPWIILTAGAQFEVFEKRLTDARKSGVKGFLAGRALWQEACQLTGTERKKFLRDTLTERFRKIAGKFN